MTTPQQEREMFEKWYAKDFGSDNDIGFSPTLQEIANYWLTRLAQREAEIREVVVCAAVLASDGTVYRGHRHGHAMQAARDEKKKLHEGTIQQGFITSRNRYVSREEARKLQDAAGIPSADQEGYRGSTLFSEDLYQPDKDVLLQALTPSE